VLAFAPARGSQGQSGPASGAPPPGLAAAIFAGGCFWCEEAAFEGVAGVESVTSGYTGGHVERPSYEHVSAGGTGHVEAIEIVYDPKRVDYERLLDLFWHNVDPLDGGGQFCDRGSQYRSVVFVRDASQRAAAEASKRALEESGRFDRPIATEIRDAVPFYPAEEHHQDYASKNPIRYRYYRSSCGRDARLTALWGSLAGHGSDTTRAH
jgi:peptide-methionine (S)-S-oxide reductase